MWFCPAIVDQANYLMYVFIDVAFLYSVYVYLCVYALCLCMHLPNLIFYLYQIFFNRIISWSSHQHVMTWSVWPDHALSSICRLGGHQGDQEDPSLDHQISKTNMKNTAGKSAREIPALSFPFWFPIWQEWFKMTCDW